MEANKKNLSALSIQKVLYPLPWPLLYLYFKEDNDQENK